MAEVWKPVPSLPGVMASSEGRILLPPRHAPLPNGGFRLYKPQPFLGVRRKAHRDARHEYLGTWVRSFGNIKIHQAVCEAFHGPKPFADAVVIHVDENAMNNRPENLKWGTQKENLNAPGIRKQMSRRAMDMEHVTGKGTRGGFLRKRPATNDPALEHRVR